MMSKRIFLLLMATALFIAANMVNRDLLGFLRIDLTEQGLYSLSPGSRDLLRKLEEPIDIRVFYSREQANDLPVVKAYASRVLEFLGLYERISGGRVRLHVIEPEPFTDAEDEAMAFGVQAVPVSNLGDKLYLGMVATNSVDKMEVVPFLDPERERFLEYDMARIIHRLSTKKLPKLGLVTSLPVDGMLDPTGGYQDPWVVMSYLRDLFEVTAVDLKGRVPEDVSVLMLVHPRELDEPSLYAIDQFVMRGGRLLAFVDPVAETSSPMGGGNQGASTLNPLLERWGVRMVPGKVVGDGTLAVRITMGSESESRLNTVYYLPWLELREGALARDHVTVSDLQLVRVASAGALETTEALAPATFTPLLLASDTSGLLDAALLEGQPDAEGMMRSFTADGVRHVMAGHLQGWLKSAFPKAPPTAPADAHLPESVQEGQVMLVADTDILRDVFWVQGQDLFGHRLVVPTADNGSFVTNMLEYLSGSQSLIALRSRGVVSRPFTVVDALQREAEAKFRDTEEELKQELKDTETRLADLQRRSMESSQAFLSSEEQATLEGFRTQLMALRKELRDVQHALQRDITGLGSLLKFLNIALVPLLLMAAALVLHWRKQRMA